jgi:hypothetical protein
MRVWINRRRTPAHPRGIAGDQLMEPPQQTFGGKGEGFIYSDPRDKKLDLQLTLKQSLPNKLTLSPGFDLSVKIRGLL